MPISTEVSDYIHAVTETRPVIEPLPAATMAGIPLYLAKVFQIRQTRLWGQLVYLAMTAPEQHIDTVQLTKFRAVLSEKLEQPVILVLPAVTAHTRKRLIQKNVPFIVPGRQLYLPMLLADLREQYPAPVRMHAAHFSWVAQVIVLRHLLHHDVTDKPLSEVARLLGYSRMAISTAADELVTMKCCEPIGKGRARTLYFHGSAQVIWEEAVLRMRSPVKKTYYLATLDTPLEALPHAGMTALGEKTDIAANSPETVASSMAEVRAAAEPLATHFRESAEDAEAILEGWAYVPTLLTNGTAVDSLSLYLSLKNQPDERIQMALEKLLKVLQ